MDLGTGEIVAIKRIKFDDGELEKEITVSKKEKKKGSLSRLFSNVSYFLLSF